MTKKIFISLLAGVIIGIFIGIGLVYASYIGAIMQAQGEAFEVALINFGIDEKYKYAVALEKYKMEYLNEIKWTIMAHEQRADWYKNMAEIMAGIDRVVIVEDTMAGVDLK